MFRRVQIPSRETRTERVRLRGIADEVARNILASDGWKARDLEDSQLFQDLARMTEDMLLRNRAGTVVWENC